MCLRGKGGQAEARASSLRARCLLLRVCWEGVSVCFGGAGGGGGQESACRNSSSTRAAPRTTEGTLAGTPPVCCVACSCHLFPPHSRTSCQPLKVPQMVHFSQKGNLRCRRCPRVPGHWTWETRPGEWRCQSSSEPAQPLRAAGGQANSGIVRAAGCRDARQPFPLARLGSPSGGKGQIGQKCAREWRAQPQGMRRSTCLA